MPWLLLLIALPIVYSIWQGERADELDIKAAAFNLEFLDTSHQLANQLTVYEQTLYGVRNFFEASDFVSNREFDDFVYDTLNAKHASGLEQVGFARRVDPKQFSTYQDLNPESQPALKRLIKQSQPSVPIIYEMTRNGFSSPSHQFYDLFENNQIKQDMEASALHSKALASERVEPNSGTESKGFSIILPIYQSALARKEVKSGVAKHDVIGWAYLNLNLKTFFNLPIIRGVTQEPGIEYVIYEGSEMAPSMLIYGDDSASAHYYKAIFTKYQPIDIYGKEWMLYAYSSPVFEAALDYKHSTKIGLFGLLIASILTAAAFLLVAKIRALRLLDHVEQRLRSTDDTWRVALEGAGDGVWDWNATSQEIVYSKAWKQMLGYEEHEIEHTYEEWVSRVHPDDYPGVLKALNAYLDGESKSYSVDFRMQCKDESWKWILSRGMTITRNAAGKPLRLVGTHTDISTQKETQAVIWQQANLDSLTGLPNRRKFYARLEQEMEKSQKSGMQLALLFLDLDDFKQVNDTLGHDQGDVLLEQAAKRLSDIIFSRDVVARLGGDEFVILITDIRAHKLKNLDLVAQKILNVLSEPFLLNSEKIYVSASIGITVYPDDATTADGLLKSVDQAMYASKKRGGNNFTYFTFEMQEAALNRLQLSNDLRMALEKQELFIEYQPIVVLQSGEIYKAEALLRWKHSERGLISPAEFIPVAEDTRLINEIGHWVLMECIQKSIDWRERFDNKRFQIAVNMSPVQFFNNEPAYSQWLTELPANSKNLIVVEITESLLLEASEQVSDRLKEYRDKGVCVALDDFGTGYSSLSYLRKFAIDYLKIDQSFVANLGVNEEDRVLCEAIIVMAHSLNIKVIAEGIETKEQRDLLLALGCDYGQGYYFSKSLPPSEFETYVKKGAKK